MKSFRFLSILLFVVVAVQLAPVAHAQCSPLRITTQPIDSTIVPFGSAKLAVYATGTPPFVYQWSREVFTDVFLPISGANSPSYDTGPLEDTQRYQVMVGDECGATVTSRTTTVTVSTGCVPPSILTQPPNVSINQGQTASLSVSATGSNLTFAWFEGTPTDTSKPVGTNSPNLTTAVLDATTTYWVRITNECAGVNSQPVTVTVNPPCPAGRLCALQARFELTLAARDHRTGATGLGAPLQQSDIFGFFSLPTLTGDPNNPEVFVKMLDGRPVTGDFWVFFGGLTDLEYTLTVEDTEAGTVKNYFKEGGTSNGGFDVGGGVAAESCAGEIDGIAGGFVLPAPCTAGSDRLCLSEARFHVSLIARDHRTDAIGAGQSIPQTDLFGYFSIPELTGNAGNPEVFVKIVDGNVVNDFYWIFFSGLTDFEYTLVVVDTFTGQTKLYKKEPGSACGFFDTNAF